MNKVIVESPFAGDIRKNIHYARLACIDCVRRGEAPYASHLLLTQFLDDEDPEQRIVGMNIGFIWAQICSKRVIYIDLGISKGMKEGIKRGFDLFQHIEYRQLPENLICHLETMTLPHSTKGI